MTTTVSGRVEGEVLLGLAFMVTGMLIVPSLDACAKLLALHMPPLEVALARFVVQGGMIVLYAITRSRTRELWPGQIIWQLLRGVALAVTTLLFFAGLAVMPLADTVAITFVEPILLTALSALILREPVAPRRWIACGIGLLGGLTIVRPSFAIFGLNALFPLGAAFSFSIYHLITRHLAGKATLIGAQFTTGVAGTVVLGAALLMTSFTGFAGQVAVMPGMEDVPLMLGMGLVSVVAHTLVLQAYDRAPAVVLAPFGYLEIVSATLLGYLIFNNFPAWPTWIGIALIVGSGLYTIIGEHQDMRPIEPGD
jgi:drug/metabolite transporter (DMT)-like permease